MKKNENDVAIVRMAETTSRIRWLSVCALLAFFGWLVKDAYVVYLKTKTPMTSTERIVSVLVTALVTLIAPSALIAYFWKRIKAFTRRMIDRLTKFEQERDPKRTSSGLMSDGTDPPGATP
jgi:hypothetical protein